MKKLLVIAATLLVCVQAVATESSEKKAERRAQRDSIEAVKNIGAQRYRSGIKLDGTRLNADQQSLLLSNISSVDYNEAWRKYNSQRAWGNGLIIGGSILAGAGTVCLGYGLALGIAGVFGAALTLGYGDTSDIFNKAGLWMGIGAAGVIVGGGSALFVGVPLKVKGTKGMGHICDGYNNTTDRVSKELILGPTPGGVGLTFRF